MALLSDTTQPITANGDYDAVMQEHNMNVNIAGTFGTAQVDIYEVNRIDTTQVSPLTGGAAITSNFTDFIEGGKGTTIRFTVTNVGGGTSLSIATQPARG
jgi:hypothetical protein